VSASYLLVALGEERYALGIEHVLEVATGPDPAPLPGAPRGVIGLQNLRGEVVPLLDLGSLVGTAPRGLGPAMVVVEGAGRRAALSVDSLLDVASLEEGAGVRDEAAPLRTSVLFDGSLVGVLDVPALLDGLRPETAR
jgi:two-component system chemotaxis response regulator CheV